MCSFQEKYATQRYVTLRYTFIFDCNMRPSDSECDTWNNNKFLNKSGYDDESEESE